MKTTAADKPQTAREVIAANVQILIEQLQAGHSEGLTAYLTAMGRFHQYSLGNILEIARQRPDATRVAGFHAWHQFGRHVKKGERGIRILAPIVAARRKPEADAHDDAPAQKRPVLVGFRSAYVFDVAQTEGQELPELDSKVSGDVGEYRERLLNFTISQGIQIEFNEAIAPALGMSYGGRIALLPGQGRAEEFATLVHELAHEMLHKAERRSGTTKTTRETEAEAIAFVVGTAIGLNHGRVSADYIHLYNGDSALLTESLEVIQRTAAVILSALEAPETIRRTASGSAGKGAVPNILAGHGIKMPRTDTRRIADSADSGVCRTRFPYPSVQTPASSSQSLRWLLREGERADRSEASLGV